jgi:putative ATPase
VSGRQGLRGRRPARGRSGEHGQGTILFLDEVHRFNKTQQDALLPHVEEGLIVLIGATTENPYFSLTGPLLSRSTLFRLDPLEPDDIRTLLERALTDSERGLGAADLSVDTDAAITWSTGRKAMPARPHVARSRRRSPPRTAATRSRSRTPRRRWRCAVRYGDDEHYDASSPRSSRASAAPILTPGCIGSLACWKPVRTRASLPAGS